MILFRTVLLTILKLFSSVSELNSTHFLCENIGTYQQKSLITLAIVLLCIKPLRSSSSVSELNSLRIASLHFGSLSFALSMSLSSRGKSALELALSSSSRSSPAFRNTLVMADPLTLLHAVRIHRQTGEKVALCIRTVFVKDFSPLVIQAYH